MFSELTAFFRKIIPSRNERVLKKIYPIVKKINFLEYSFLTEEELEEKNRLCEEGIKEKSIEEILPGLSFLPSSKLEEMTIKCRSSEKINLKVLFPDIFQTKTNEELAQITLEFKENLRKFLYEKFGLETPISKRLKERLNFKLELFLTLKTLQSASTEDSLFLTRRELELLDKLFSTSIKTYGEISFNDTLQEKFIEFQEKIEEEKRSEEFSEAKLSTIGEFTTEISEKDNKEVLKDTEVERIKSFIESILSSKEKENKTEILREKAIDLLEDIIYDTESYREGIGREAQVFEDGTLKIIKQYFADVLKKEEISILDEALKNGKILETPLSEELRDSAEFLKDLIPSNIKTQINENQFFVIKHFFGQIFFDEFISSIVDLLPVKEMKSRLGNDIRKYVEEYLESILPKAFALVREASKRTLKMRHFDVQLIGGIVLHRGKIAEMKTGEGKTLVATLPAYLNALTGLGMHIVTVNDYLARRDRAWMGPIFELLGLTCGVIQHDMSNEERKKQYFADITYGTNNEFGFDYLRDNLKTKEELCVQRGHNYAIVDEVDSILIDEARTPLIISGEVEKDTNKYELFKPMVEKLVHEQKARIQRIFKEAISFDEEDEDSEEKYKKLLQIEKGDPKFKPLLEYIADPEHKETRKRMNTLEAELNQLKQINTLEEGLLYTVSEKEHNADLTDEGRSKLSQPPWFRPIIKDFLGELYLIDNSDFSIEEKEKKKNELISKLLEGGKKNYSRADLLDIKGLYEELSNIFKDQYISPEQKEKAVLAKAGEYEIKNKNLKNISYEKFSEFWGLFEEKREIINDKKLDEEEKEIRIKGIEQELNKLALGDLFVLPDLDVDIQKIDQDKLESLEYLKEEYESLQKFFDNELKELKEEYSKFENNKDSLKNEEEVPQLLIGIIAFRETWRRFYLIDKDEKLNLAQKTSLKEKLVFEYYEALRTVTDLIKEIYRIRKGESDQKEEKVISKIKEITYSFPGIYGLVQKVLEVIEGTSKGKKKSINEIINKNEKTILNLKQIFTNISEITKSTLSNLEKTKKIELAISNEVKEFEKFNKIWEKISSIKKEGTGKEEGYLIELIENFKKTLLEGLKLYDELKEVYFKTDEASLKELITEVKEEKNIKFKNVKGERLEKYLIELTNKFKELDIKRYSQYINSDEEKNAFNKLKNLNEEDFKNFVSLLKEGKVEKKYDFLVDYSDRFEGIFKNIIKEERKEEILEKYKEVPYINGITKLDLFKFIKYFEEERGIEQDFTIKAEEKTKKLYEINKKLRLLCLIDNKIPLERQINDLLFEKERFAKNYEEKKLEISSKYEAKKENLLIEFEEKSEKIHNINQLLKAYTLFERDVEYVVMENKGEQKVLIVDEFTGRIMPGRRYSDGLHEAIEAKEGVKVEKASQTIATITLQNYFRMYKKLAGMTGTADTEAAEFHSIYKLEVIVIPTNEPMIRVDHPDVIYKTVEEKLEAVVMEIVHLYLIGRPVLVGTTSVEASERLSNMLDFTPFKGKYPQGINVVKKITDSICNNIDGLRDDLFDEISDNIDEEIFKAYKKNGKGLDKIAKEITSILVDTKDINEYEKVYTDILNRLKKGVDSIDDIWEVTYKGSNYKEIFEGNFIKNIKEKAEEVIREKKIPHQVLNARHHEKEAQIVAKAGQRSTVTIATNMAGRGTDIILGDDVKYILGGLHILGTERHESRRIDNQLRGRAGRQGDKGSSRFYLSLEDDLMRIFGSDRIATIMERLGMERGTPIEHSLVTRAIENAQKKVEARNFIIRKRLLEYDNVNNKQREIIYGKRNQIIKTNNIKKYLFEMIDDVIESLLNTYAPYGSSPAEWDIQGLKRVLWEKYRVYEPLEDIESISTSYELHELIYSNFSQAYRKKERDFAKKIQAIYGGYISLDEIVRSEMLRIIDSNWMDHLMVMDQIKEGIGLRGYGQKDPLIEYKKEGFNAFAEMMSKINSQVIEKVFQIYFVVEERKKEKNITLIKELPSLKEEEKKIEKLATNTSEEDIKPKPVVRKEKKIGRNDPCPCGSGKKYKKCCGI